MGQCGGVLPRLLALVVIVSVLPTIEIGEQIAHAVEHVINDEPAAHSAHHDGDGQDDEHGCTGLVHICGCHHTLVTGGGVPATAIGVETLETLGTGAPRSLDDQSTREPPHRPPIS
jgi:hypothetical protein